MTGPVTAIGLMSGTSMDGVDAAVLVTDGEAHIEPGFAHFTPYGDDVRRAIGAAIGAAAGLKDRSARPGPVGAAEKLVTEIHGEAVRVLLAGAGLKASDIELIGFHGQTILHAPEQRLTIQIGDGQALAGATGIDVVDDFRARDMAAGGEGAPLAPVYHRALAHRLDRWPVCFINIGGVANVTWIGADDGMIAFDTGPGNALMDDWAMEHLGTRFDRDGALAREGVFDHDAFLALAEDKYFERPPPKSLDRNHFDRAALQGLSPADGAATLLHFTATSIARAQDWFPKPAAVWVICGGGRHNPVLVRELRDLLEPLGAVVKTAEQMALDGDFIEAQAFAFMAVRSLRHLPLTYPGTTGVRTAQSGGLWHKADKSANG